MTRRTALIITSWFLSALTIGLAFAVWAPRRGSFNAYDLFPLFGLLAFGLMWSHYASGALRQWLRLPEDVLRQHFQITSAVVLFLLLAHPFVIELQLYLDGFGLPPESFAMLYPALIDRAALLAGAAALTIFLAFELHRFYRDRPWWKYVERANIAAMVLILWHGFILGGELRQPWFQLVWTFYAVTFVGAVGYTEYSKRRTMYGKSKEP